jgi:uncharacterized membrane protein YphA (DoxX/SURF4 family)
VISTSGNSTKRWIAHLCALGVAGFFLYAAATKVYYDQRQFAIEIGNYRILPRTYVNIPAILMPWIEIGAAIALLLPATRRSGAILIIGMLLIFIAAVSYSALYLGLTIECGCTGKGGGPAGWKTIGRNTLLIAGVLLSVFLLPRRKALADGAIPA